MGIIRRIADDLNGRYKRMLASRSTATNPRHNDVYIVEFPRSGITWLSAMLANMALLASGRSEVASFTTSHLYIPDIHVTKTIGEMAYDVPPVRLIKSHAEFNPHYAFVVYLARHPLHVMRSFYRFKLDRADEVGDFDSFCRSRRYGVPAWRRHVNSWLTGGIAAQRLHLIRYEDLVEDAASELRTLNENFGWRIREGIIDEAVSRCSVEKMKAAENLYRTRNPRYTMHFVKAENDLDVSGETIEYIEKQCRDELSMLGYEGLDDGNKGRHQERSADPRVQVVNTVAHRSKRER